MPAVATMPPYTLVLREDGDIQNPREDMDTFGTMVCFHRRYNLGDAHDYSSPEDFLRDLARDTISAKDICDFAIAEKAKGVELKYDLDSGKWAVLSFYNDDWHIVESFEGELAGQEEIIADALLEEMEVPGLLRLAELENIVLPLYLYDHSGLSMSTMTFEGRARHAEWDSGQVGWFHCKKEISGETEAMEAMEAEVAYYDSYLRGEAYGFQLYQDGAEVDSCWGFIGSLDELKADIEGYLPEECSGIMESLDYNYSDSEIDDLLHEQQYNILSVEGDSFMSNTENPGNLGFEARAYPVKEPKNNVLAMASLNFETAIGSFAITDLRVVQGKNGPFVAMPSMKDREGNFKDIAFPTTKEGRAQMNTAIMDAYNDALLGKGERAAEKSERPSAADKLNDAKKEAAKAPKAEKGSKAKAKSDPGIE